MSIDTKKIVVHASEFNKYFDAATEVTMSKALSGVKVTPAVSAVPVMHYFKTLIDNFNRALYDKLFFHEGDVIFTITSYETLMRTAIELAIEQDTENREFLGFPEDALDAIFQIYIWIIRDVSKSILKDKM